MAQATPELFADGACGRPLPAGEVLQEFRFGQFCPFTVLDGTSTATVLVGERPGTRGRTSSASFKPGLDGRDRVGFAEVLELEGASASGGGRALAAAAASLPPGRAVAVASAVGGNGGDGGDTGAIVDVAWEIEEEDLDAFLRRPVLTAYRERVLLELLPEEEAELRSTGRLCVEVGGDTDVNITYRVTLTVRRGAKPDTSGGPAPSGGGPSAPSGTESGKDTAKNPDYDPTRMLPPAQVDDVLLAVYLEWTQRWTLKGFSRGRLVQSLALAPQEETTIELFTWDRKKTVLEQASMTETETTMEDEEKTQDTTEVFRELTKKDEFELKAGGNLDVQYDGGTVKVKVGGTAEGRDKSNVDDVTKNTTKAIREGLHKSANRIKVQRSSKVTETTEQGSEQRITRKVRNPNQCHTLNLDYYEILTHYAIDTEFNKDGMRFCAMIRNPIAETRFCRAFIRQHEGPLRDVLLDRSLATGFDAVRMLRARQVAVAELAKRRKEREEEALHAPPVPVPAIQGSVSVEESAANNHLANMRTAAQTLMDSGLAHALDNVLDGLGDGKSPVASDLDEGKRWLAQQLFLRSFSQLSMALRELAKATEPVDIREWGPRLESVMPDPTSMPRPSQLNLETQEVKQGLLRPALWTSGGPEHVKHDWDWNWWWGEVRRVGLLEAEDAGVGSLVEQFAKVYRAFLEAEKRNASGGESAKAMQAAVQAQDRLSDDDRLENDFPLRDYSLAEERAEVLERHLQEHSDHYSFALFRALPPQEQLNYIELAMSSISPSFEPGFFEPRVVSQIGRRLLVPLNHSVIDRATEFLEMLKSRVEPAKATDDMMLPSPGMSIDARLGQCTACEDFVEETRKIDLELRHAQLRQAVAEAARCEQRLVANPPQLEDPTAPVPELSVKINQPIH